MIDTTFYSSQKQQRSNWTEAVVSLLRHERKEVNSGTYIENLVESYSS